MANSSSSASAKLVTCNRSSLVAICSKYRILFNLAFWFAPQTLWVCIQTWLEAAANAKNNDCCIAHETRFAIVPTNGT